MFQHKTDFELTGKLWDARCQYFGENNRFEKHRAWSLSLIKQHEEK